MTAQAPQPAVQATVLQGQGGWLFLDRDRNDAIGQHTGRVKFNRGQRAAWRKLLTERKRLADQLETTWICHVVPDKEAVYSEFLPSHVRLAPRRPIHDLLEIAKVARAPVTYALDELLIAKREHEVYAKTDTHWNHRGAYATYGSLCERASRNGVRVEPIDPSAIIWGKVEAAADLGSKLKPPRTSQVTSARLRQHKSRLIFDNGVSNHGRVMIFEQPTKELPSCLVFGESYANHLLIFLKESFGRLVFVHTSTMSEEIIRNERPELVVSSPVERFLISVPRDAGALQALRATVRAKAMRGEWGHDGFTRTIPRNERAAYRSRGELPWQG